jgi:hypothetical protein
MSKKTSRNRNVRADLEAAATAQSLVRVVRSIRCSDELEGFVVGLGVKWLLLALLDGNIYLNGFVALRLRDVTKVQQRGGIGSFVGRALTLRGHWPPTAPAIDLDTVGGVIRSAGEAAPLVTLHVEADDPNVCLIGRPAGITGRSVQLREITPEAEWKDRPTKWKLADVTRVEFGGRYEEALALVGGTPPE